MTDRFLFEQQIMASWNVVEDLKTLHEGVVEKGLTTDQISNILLGMQELYQLKFDMLFQMFETLIRNKEL